MDQENTTVREVSQTKINIVSHVESKKIIEMHLYIKPTASQTESNLRSPIRKIAGGIN